MTGIDPEDYVQHLVARSRDADDPTRWFEQLYGAAADGKAVVPWDRGAPHPLLVDWVRNQRLRAVGRTALIVGCGLGWDAEFVAGLGFDTTAFDVAPSAIEAARRQFPTSAVRYRVANLFSLPHAWQRHFDFVVESLTVQSLPRAYRAEVTSNVCGLVKAGGTLLVIAAASDVEQPIEQGPPWPLTSEEVHAFGASGLEKVRVERLPDFQRPEVTRWRAEFTRAGRLRQQLREKHGLDLGHQEI